MTENREIVEAEAGLEELMGTHLTESYSSTITLFILPHTRLQYAA